MNENTKFCSFFKARTVSYKDDGNEEFKKGKYQKAIKIYTEGIKINCGDPILMSILFANRANAHFKIGKYSLTTTYLQERSFYGVCEGVAPPQTVKNRIIGAKVYKVNGLNLGES